MNNSDLPITALCVGNNNINSIFSNKFIYDISNKSINESNRAIEMPAKLHTDL